MNTKVIEILVERIEALEWVLKLKEEKVDELEIELAECKKAALDAWRFGNEVVD